MSAAWQTSSNRQSGTRIWAAWSGRERGSWHPGLTAQRRPGGAARAGASLDSLGASAGHGVGPTARDPPSAQGPASRSSEGVGRTGTLPRRGGADGGAVHEPAPRSRARWGAAGGAGSGGRQARVQEVGPSRSPQSGVVPAPFTALLTYLLAARHGNTHAQVQTHGRPVAPIPSLLAPPPASLPASNFLSFSCSWPVKATPVLLLFFCLSVSFSPSLQPLLSSLPPNRARARSHTYRPPSHPHPPVCSLISLLLTLSLLGLTVSLFPLGWPLALPFSVSFFAPISLLSTRRVEVCGGLPAARPCFSLLCLFQQSPESFLTTDPEFFLHSLVESSNL